MRTIYNWDIYSECIEIILYTPRHYYCSVNTLYEIIRKESVYNPVFMRNNIIKNTDNPCFSAFFGNPRNGSKTWGHERMPVLDQEDFRVNFPDHVTCFNPVKRINRVQNPCYLY